MWMFHHVIRKEKGVLGDGYWGERKRRGENSSVDQILVLFGVFVWYFCFKVKEYLLLFGEGLLCVNESQKHAI